MSLQSVRAQLGTVLQDAFLFNSSIRANIALHNPDMLIDDIMKAAKTGEIHSDILQMPMGYETRIGEDANSLSGGQCQRIAIARAVAHKPGILMLDEATSHLDATTEALVHRNLDELSCTRVVIAHRLSTIQNADLIVLLHEGSIVERGCHQELMALNGYYADLVRDQLS